MLADEVNVYEKAEIYDVIYGDYKDDLAFYLHFIEKFGQPVLEVACGTGRISVPLAKKGVDIIGFDLSAEMVALAKRKAARAGVDIPLYVSDMRDFELKQQFSFIFIPAQSFQNMLSKTDVERCLASIKRHLRHDGAFLLQIFQPSFSSLTRDPASRAKLGRGDFYDPVSRQHFHISVRLKYDPASQILDMLFYYHSDNDPVEKTLELRMRQFFPKELDALLEYNGFEIIAKYGDRNFTPYDENPQYQNVLCRLRR